MSRLPGAAFHGVTDGQGLKVVDSGPPSCLCLQVRLSNGDDGPKTIAKLQEAIGLVEATNRAMAYAQAKMDDRDRAVLSWWMSRTTPR